MKVWTIFTSMALLSLVQTSTFALSETVLIKPERTDLGHIRFSLEVETTSAGVKYFARIALPKGMRAIYRATLSSVRITHQGGHIQGIQGIALREADEGFSAEFEIPASLLDKEGISFVISENHESMPSATFYILNLHDFPPNRQKKPGEGTGEKSIIAQAEDDGPVVQNHVIMVVVMGEVNKPGKIAVLAESPTALDVWKLAGGGNRLFGRRVTLSRVDEEGTLQSETFVFSRREGEEFQKELRKISVRDSDVLRFHALCEYF